MLRTFLTALAVLVTLAAAEARAYVMPADFILRSLAEKRRRLTLQDLTVHLSLELPGEETPIEETIYLKPPERMRRVRQNEDNVMVLLVRENEMAEGPENALKRGKGPVSDLLPALLMPRGDDLDLMEARLLEVVARAGIDTRVVSLVHEGENMFFIIGAPPKTPDKPQLWIEKESFLPARAVVLQKSDGKSARIETRWSDFGASTSGEYFPRTIDVYKDGVLSEHAEVSKVEANKKVPDTLFDLP